MASIYAITLILSVSLANEDPCEAQQCELYPQAICLSSTTTTHSNHTLFMDDDGNVINDNDCDCTKNHKLDNEQCLAIDEDSALTTGQYYISIDLSFDVEQTTGYQNHRDVLFSDITECVDVFISDITSIPIASYPSIQSYSHSKHHSQDNDFFDANEDKSAVFERFHFTFAVNDLNIDNSTFLYEATTDTYRQAVNAFSKCALLLSEKTDSEGFRTVSNTSIDAKLSKMDNGSNMGGAHVFAFTSLCLGALLMMKKGIWIPLARFWCNFFACCHHWHCFYCYNPCTQATSDCGLSCCGFGCGCVNGCCPGFSCTFFCWQCHC
eukprot:69677_1